MRMGERLTVSLGTRMTLTDESAAGGLSAIGLVVAEHVDKIPFFVPELAVESKTIEANRITLELRSVADLTKSLDEILRGYKIGCFKIAREYRLVTRESPGPIFEPFHV